jgi:DNA-binding IclR family transcriptional regulator
MFVEMPGTEWTVAEAARLSGLESSVCRAILDALRQVGFFTQRANGTYVRCLIPVLEPGAPAGA